MKIAVLGGAGMMGRRAVQDIAFQEDVKEVIIGDLNLGTALEVAEKTNQRVGLKKVTAVQIDATVPSTVTAALEGCDAAANAVGPYYQFGRAVTGAAINAGIKLADLCDDYDAVRQILELDEEARSEGATVLTGMGWTPGLSNMLAMKACRELDQPQDVRIDWVGSPVGDSGLAVILHTLHIFTGSVPSFEGGKLVEVPAGSGRETVKFANLGEFSMFHVGHPEPLTIPRAVGGLEKVTVKGGLTDHFLNETSLVLKNTGLTAAGEGKHLIATLLKAMLPMLGMFLTSYENRSAVRVVVSGLKDNRQETLSYEACGEMADLTGLPLAIGTLMLARGELQGSGVFPVEALMDVDRFFEETGSRAIEVTRVY